MIIAYTQQQPTMQTYMTKMMAAAQEMALAAVTEFVEHAKSNGVDIPAEMVAEFFSGQGVKMTKAGKVSKASVKASGRGTGKASPGKRTPMFDFLGEEVEDGVRRRDEIKAILGDDYRREATIAEYEAHFAAEPKQLAKCTGLRQWFDQHQLGDKGAPAQVVNKLGGIMWAALTEDERDIYKAGAKAANEELAVAVAVQEEQEQEQVQEVAEPAVAVQEEQEQEQVQEVAEPAVAVQEEQEEQEEEQQVQQVQEEEQEDDGDDSEIEEDEYVAPPSATCSNKRCNKQPMDGSDMCSKHLAKAMKVSSRRKKRQVQGSDDE